MNEFKSIILCADDFGLSQGISLGILKLAAMRRLSAVSCMVNCANFIFHAKELLALKKQVHIGLHFNLTEGNLISEPETVCCSLNELLIKAHLRLIKPSLIAKEFNAQLDQFIEIMGCAPDFIDGHQHVHQFPGIREVILDLYEQRLKHHKPYIRSTYSARSLPKYQFKTNILKWTGGKALHVRLNQLGIAHNNCFLGVYDFSRGTNYRALFRQWLSLVQSSALIMCHPGEGISNLDSITHARAIEMDYFLSDSFVSDCQEYRIKLG